MSVDYIRQSISDGEELIHIAHFHWMYMVGAFLNALFSFFLALFIIIIALKFEPMIFGTVNEGVTFTEQIMNLHAGVKILAFFIFVMGLLKFAQMMIIKATTEIGVTDIRLVYKRGLIARAVGEINIDRVEGVNVLQGVFGRLFGYGRVMVRGMGIGEVILPPIAQPIRFKKAIEHARSKAKKKNNTVVMPTEQQQ